MLIYAPPTSGKSYYLEIVNGTNGYAQLDPKNGFYDTDWAVPYMFARRMGFRLNRQDQYPMSKSLVCWAFNSFIPRWEERFPDTRKLWNDVQDEVKAHAKRLSDRGAIVFTNMRLSPTDVAIHRSYEDMLFLWKQREAEHSGPVKEIPPWLNPEHISLDSVIKSTNPKRIITLKRGQYLADIITEVL